ncbi:unnamed protein product [Acanthosepion pharaonis]|uniref:CCHC-type domain-containing protein n=1 Tax=Acanthosepion pharaonis TaxID=158019 RepID=A0A812BUU5_ACAPH|nr:unnamed protein product [Sepia pharaonis]
MGYPVGIRRLAGSILSTKSVRLQTEYLGTRKTKVILHGGPLFISLDHLGFFFSKFGEVASVSAVKSKAGIATEDVEVIVTVTRKNFVAIPNVLTFEGRPIYVTVEGRRPLCWACGVVGHLSKTCPGKRPEPQPENTTAKEKTDTSAKVTKKISWRVDGSGKEGNKGCPPASAEVEMRPASAATKGRTEEASIGAGVSARAAEGKVTGDAA